jgi:CheY-specific phosphatase CheX
MIATPQLESTVFPAAVAKAMRVAIRSTFTAILGAEPALQDAAPQTRGARSVVGTISFLGDLTWSYSLVVPEDTAPALAQKFVGFEVPFDSSDMGDLVGELANVLAGDVIAQLERRHIRAQMSLPVIARGSDMEMVLPAGTPSMHLNYDTAPGPFWFSLASARPDATLGRRPGT